MTPIPKKTSLTSPSDLRLISKTLIISKVFEDFILQWLLAEVEHKIALCSSVFVEGTAQHIIWSDYFMIY